MQQIINQRVINQIPRGLSNRIELRCSYKHVGLAVQYAMDMCNINYTYPDYNSIFLIEDPKINAQIIISNIGQHKKYIIEFERYGGDGFMMHKIIYCILDYYIDVCMDTQQDITYKSHIQWLREAYNINHYNDEYEEEYDDEEHFDYYNINDEVTTYGINVI